MAWSMKLHLGFGELGEHPTAVDQGVKVITEKGDADLSSNPPGINWTGDSAESPSKGAAQNSGVGHGHGRAHNLKQRAGDESIRAQSGGKTMLSPGSPLVLVVRLRLFVSSTLPVEASG
jgi:hypothetical protein